MVRNIIFILFLFSLPYRGFSQTTFFKTYGVQGGSGSAALHWDGGYVISGTMYNPGNNWDYGVIKTDSEGNAVWQKYFGGFSGEFGGYIIPTKDSGFVIVGHSPSFGALTQIYMVKIDSYGNLEWEKTYGGQSGEKGYAVEQTQDDGFIIVGSSQSFGNGYSDIYLVKTDSVGDTLWTKVYGMSGFDEGQDVKQTFDKGFIVVGGITDTSVYEYSSLYILKTDSLGDTLWTKTIAAPGGTTSDFAEHVLICSDSSYLVLGLLDGSIIIKINDQGNILYTISMDTIRIKSIVEIKDGGYVIAYLKNYTNNYTIGLVKYDANWNVLWKRLFNSGDELYVEKLIQTPDGGYLLAGYARDITDTYYLLIKTDSLGNAPQLVSVSELLPSQNISVRVYPNPFSETLTIEIKTINDNLLFSFTLYDPLGRNVRNVKQIKVSPTLSGQASLKFQVERKGLSDGLYFYRVNDNKGNFVNGKIVIQQQ